MTDLTREQIEALLDGATPGPWACHFGNDNITCDCKYVLADYGGMGSIATIDVCKEMHGEWGDDNGPSVDVAKANARLIAAVPDLARQLLATLDALADAQAAQAMVVEQCAGVVKTTHDLMNLAMPGDWNNDDGELLRALEDDIRALAPPSGLAKLAELRAERDAASAMAATAYGASLNWEEVLNDEALWQVQDDIAKSRVACMTAEAERDRLAAANAVLEAKVAGLVEALRNLVGPDCMYDGRNIVITAVNHGDAIRLVAEARAALATQEAGT